VCPRRTCASARSLLPPLRLSSGVCSVGGAYCTELQEGRKKEHAVKKIAGKTLVALGVMGLVALGAGSAGPARRRQSIPHAR
jgi:hypothetical protein